MAKTTKKAALVKARKEHLLSRGWTEVEGGKIEGKLSKRVPSGKPFYWETVPPYDEGWTIDSFGREIDYWKFPWRPEHGGKE